MIQTLEDWLEKQDVVQIRTIKQEEEDKFILALGEYNVSPIEFNTYEEAEKFLKDNFKFNNFELSIIGAMCSQLNKLENQILNNQIETK